MILLRQVPDVVGSLKKKHIKILLKTHCISNQQCVISTNAHFLVICMYVLFYGFNNVLTCFLASHDTGHVF
jgi:hypothetical protein